MRPPKWHRDEIILALDLYYKLDKKNLDSSNSEGITKLTDLALVCSNCHRMLHKKIDVLSILELKKIISS